jgi:hypothetical protein
LKTSQKPKTYQDETIRISGAGCTEMGMTGSNREGRGIIAPLDSTNRVKLKSLIVVGILIILPFGTFILPILIGNVMFLIPIMLVTP